MFVWVLHAGIYFLALYCGFMFLLASPLTPVSVVWTLHDWNVLLVIAGRVRQDFVQPPTPKICMCTFFFLIKTNKNFFFFFFVFYVVCVQFFQAGSNFKCGHTGQLSALSVFLDFLGSLGRIFSSLQVQTHTHAHVHVHVHVQGRHCTHVRETRVGCQTWILFQGLYVSNWFWFKCPITQMLVRKMFSLAVALYVGFQKQSQIPETPFKL